MFSLSRRLCSSSLVSDATRVLRTTRFTPNRVLRSDASIQASPNYASLIKPFCFTVSVCGTSFVVATVCRYENRDKYFNNFFRSSPSHHSSRSRSSFLNDVKRYWDSKGEGFQVFCGLALVNTLVFVCWRIPRFSSTMMKYFLTQLDSKSIRCLPMILSNFSHFSPFHLGLNMLVLYSFSNICVHLYGKEHFLALYLSAGVMSSFTSIVHKVITRSLTPSLGASGAILGILAATCIERPDIQLMIIFLPFFSFSAYTALQGIILFDVAGLIFRFGFFDHAAHLGGSLFGVYYAKELKNIVAIQRPTIIKYWNEFKSKF